MHPQVLEDATKQLGVFRDRMVSLIPFQMTHDECLDLISPPSHHHILRTAAEVAEMSSGQDWLSLVTPLDYTAQLQMRTHGEHVPPLRPRHPRWHPDKPGGTKVLDWLNKRLELGARFGLAQRLLVELNNKCENGAQLRAMMPAVMHLVTNSVANNFDRTNAWAEKHAVFKPQKHMPYISVDARAAVRDAGALITGCVLIGPDAKPEVPDGVLIDCWDLGAFTFEGSYVRRM
jgi:hypothetical protein